MDETSGCVLRGQLVSAAIRAETLTLDCILAPEGREWGSPVEFTARFSDGASRSLHSALELLVQWADEAAPIEVLVGDDRAGPQLRITSASTRVVLTTTPGAGNR